MNNEFLNMRKAASAGKLNPSKHTWDKIESRLKIENQESKIRSLSFQKMILSIASCTLLAISIYTISSQMNSQYHPKELSKLEAAESDIYSISNVRKANSLYK